jgi:hypothetical protein
MKIFFQQRICDRRWQWATKRSDFQTVFTDAAEFIPLRGGEAVMGSRLSGIQPYIVRVRSSIASRAVGADWQIVDARSGVVYAITAPPTNQDQKNAWLDIMVTQGRAS